MSTYKLNSTQTASARRVLVAACLASLGLFVGPSSAPASDWMLYPSYYTHDPATGQRVAQYAAKTPAMVRSYPGAMQSGYRHTQSTLRVGPQADYLHVVQEWGRPVRPYGEWQFPYRPYSVPYWQWGSPWAGAVIAPGWWGYPMPNPYGVPRGGGLPPAAVPGRSR